MTGTLNDNLKNPQKKPAKKRGNRAKWMIEDTTPFALCKGAEIDSSVYEISENRYYTLILKGLVVYFITAGGLGAYLTAMDIDFNQLVFNVVVLVSAIICAMLYHSWRSENLGYLLFFMVYASLMIIFKDYINSGFYAVINDTIDWASIYFGTEGLQYYNERIQNRYVAITIAMSIIGVAANVLLNNYILRNARYIVAICLSITVNIFAFYMEKEPDTIYTIMVIAGLVMTYVLKSGKHYTLSRRDHIFERKKKGISYILDYRSLWQGLLTVFIYVLVMVAALSIMFDKVSYDAIQEKSENKEISKDYFQNFIMLGIFGLIDYYPNNGGLSTGELGGVSSIRLDYMTDITVLYTPYSMDTLYIKNFTGGRYSPYENRWYSTTSVSPTANDYKKEVDALADAYKNGEEYSAKGYMTITNVEAPVESYQPYYSEGGREEIFWRDTKTYVYYPRFAKSTAVLSDTKGTPEDEYLMVPEANKEAVDAFIEEAGLTRGEPLDVAEQLRDYYQENVPYTIRPGATPWRQDFVNYFLTKNKKGYCAHFASAATLIFREMGIPARYCEGYAISYVQVLDTGELVEGEKYEDRYDGYNELGETALVRVDATDADAHAWVEIYDDTYGWTKVEVTPSSGIEEEEEDRTSFWDTFNNIFGDGNENANDRSNNTNINFNLSKADQIMRVVAYVIIILLIIVILSLLGLKVYPDVRYRIDYNKAGLSDKLILKYSRLLKRWKKKDINLRDRMNYHEQMDCLLPYSESKRERMINILERAGFSNKEISSEDFSYADTVIEELDKEKKKRKKA